MRFERILLWHYQSAIRVGLIALVSVFLSSPVFAGKVYKCVSEDASIVYQQTPCCEEEQEEEIALPDFVKGEDDRESEHAASIRALKKKSDIQYLEINIKESERRIESLQKARQTKVDYWRGVILYATEQVQTIKLEKIINSVKDNYDRKIEKEQEKRRALEKATGGIEVESVFLDIAFHAGPPATGMLRPGTVNDC